MNKTILASALIAGCTLAGLGMAAGAQNAPQASTTDNQQSAASAGQQQQAPKPKPFDHNCVRDTGSHIPPPKGGCLPVAGRSYSHEDIQRTGATNIGDALQQLDSSVTVHHGHGGG